MKDFIETGMYPLEIDKRENYLVVMKIFSCLISEQCN